MTKSTSRLNDILEKNEKEILDDWMREQLASGTLRKDLITESELRKQSAELLGLIINATRSGNVTEISGTEWKPVLDFLAATSKTRAAQGFSPVETATFIFSMKQPIFTRLKKEAGSNASVLADEIWVATVLTDKLGLFTAETYQKSREEIIRRQQMELLELSTPVIRIWEGILVLPLIGTLDSSRTQIVMETLLQNIVDTNSGIAIIDITGVPAVDTLVAQHLIKTVSAARLMGAQCIISGIRPQIAQTMVHLGVAFGDVVTKASLADALKYAFRQSGITVT
ncbi:MAG: STAS domain-containing protein [Methanoregula sp.]|nr:STAS domain-containing protein [Methanoregula sp.]